MNNRKKGSIYEDRAIEYLMEKGYEILKKNFRNRFGEVDIIAKDKDYLVFIEVKYRKNQAKGYAIEAVTTKKAQKIRLMAEYYLFLNKIVNQNIRFDILSIDNEKFQHIKDAF